MKPWNRKSPPKRGQKKCVKHKQRAKIESKWKNVQHIFFSLLTHSVPHVCMHTWWWSKRETSTIWSFMLCAISIPSGLSSAKMQITVWAGSCINHVDSFIYDQLYMLDAYSTSSVRLSAVYCDWLAYLPQLKVKVEIYAFLGSVQEMAWATLLIFEQFIYRSVNNLSRMANAMGKWILQFNQLIDAFIQRLIRCRHDKHQAYSLSVLFNEIIDTKLIFFIIFYYAFRCRAKLQRPD